MIYFFIGLIGLLAVLKAFEIVSVLKESNGKCLQHDFERIDPDEVELRLFLTLQKFKLVDSQYVLRLAFSAERLVSGLFITHAKCKKCNYRSKTDLSNT